MNEKRARMLAAAGLTAGLALGSIAISMASVGVPWNRPAAVVRAAAGKSSFKALNRDDDDDGNGLPVTLPGLVASLTGMDVRDVEWQLHAGSSLADIARSKGLVSEAVVTAAGVRFAGALEADVAAGRISESQRARIVAFVLERYSKTMTLRSRGDEG